MKKGWEIKKLGEVAEYHKEQGLYTNLQYVGMEYIASETGKLLMTTDSANMKSSAFKFDKGDVLYGRLRPYLKKVIVADFEGCCSTEIFPIKAKKVLPYFLKYWFLTDLVTNELNKTAAGCRMPRANMNKALDFFIPVPPLSEQRRIVSVLDAAFAKIEAVKEKTARNLQNAKELFQSELQKCMSPQSSTNKKGWEIKKLGEVAEIITGTTPPTKNKDYWGGKIKWITPAEISEQNKIVMDSVKHITELAVKKCSLRINPAGSVIFSSRAPIGKVAIAGVDLYCNQGFKNFFCKGTLFNQFLFYFLVSKKNYLNSIGKGTTFKEVSKSAISEVKILVPPMSEQKQIVSRLDVLSAQVKQLEANYNTVLADCDELKQSVLAKAFDGAI